MKSFINSTIISAICLSLGSQSILADAPVSDAYSPGESDSKWILGAGIYGLNNPYIHDKNSDDEYLGVLDIRLEYRGERFFVDDAGLGVTLFRANGFSTGIILSGNDSYLSDIEYYKDNERLDGIKERDATADLGIYLIHNSDIGQFKVTALDEISGEHDGQTVNVNYVRNIPLTRWNITPYIGATWSSKETVQHFFGVSQSETTADRVAYNGKNTTDVYAGISARYDINDHWDININQTYIKFGDGVAHSPLIQDDYATVTSFGVNYNF